MLARFVPRNGLSDPDVIEPRVIRDKLPWESAGVFVVRAHFDEPHAHGAAPGVRKSRYIQVDRNRDVGANVPVAGDENGAVGRRRADECLRQSRITDPLSKNQAWHDRIRQLAAVAVDELGTQHAGMRLRPRGSMKTGVPDRVRVRDDFCLKIAAKLGA